MGVFLSAERAVSPRRDGVYGFHFFFSYFNCNDISSTLAARFLLNFYMVSGADGDDLFAYTFHWDAVFV
jgi:hypothetical protein